MTFQRWSRGERAPSLSWPVCGKTQASPTMARTTQLSVGDAKAVFQSQSQRSGVTWLAWQGQREKKASIAVWSDVPFSLLPRYTEGPSPGGKSFHMVWELVTRSSWHFLVKRKPQASHLMLVEIQLPDLWHGFAGAWPGQLLAGWEKMHMKWMHSTLSPIKHNTRSRGGQRFPAGIWAKEGPWAMAHH
jgi:hypothetical protein